MFDDPGMEISQQLTNTFEVGQSYQITVGIAGGGYGMPLGTPREIGLYYLDGSGNQVVVGTTTITNNNSLTDGQYISDLPDYVLSIPTVAASNAWAGQQIGVALIQTSTGTTSGGGYWDIDNVRLESVPEPGSLALLAAAGFGLFVVQRWFFEKAVCRSPN